MPSIMGTISGFATVVLLVQVCRRVIPWLYENIIGPKFFGAQVKPRTMGEWASEYIIILLHCGVGRVSCVRFLFLSPLI